MISRSLTISPSAGIYRSTVRMSELSRFIANSDSSNSSSLSAWTNRAFLLLGAAGDDRSRGAGRPEILAAVRGVMSLLAISLFGGGEAGGRVDSALAGSSASFLTRWPRQHSLSLLRLSISGRGTSSRPRSTSSGKMLACVSGSKDLLPLPPKLYLSVDRGVEFRRATSISSTGGMGISKPRSIPEKSCESNFDVMSSRSCDCLEGVDPP